MKCSFRNCLTPLCNGTTTQLYLLSILLATSVVSQNVNGYGISRQWLFFYLLKFCDCKVILILAIIEGQNHICKSHILFEKVHNNLARVKKMSVFFPYLKHEWVLFYKTQKFKNWSYRKISTSQALTKTL